MQIDFENARASKDDVNVHECVLAVDPCLRLTKHLSG